jgi:hypothetical protein
VAFATLRSGWTDCIGAARDTRKPQEWWRLGRVPLVIIDEVG